MTEVSIPYTRANVQFQFGPRNKTTLKVSIGLPNHKMPKGGRGEPFHTFTGLRASCYKLMEALDVLCLGFYLFLGIEKGLDRVVFGYKCRVLEIWIRNCAMVPGFRHP